MPDCNHCEQGFHREELNVTAHGDFICEPCRDNHYDYSGEDDELYMITELVRDTERGEFVTREQLDERHRYCEECNETVHVDCFDSDGDEYCASCMEHMVSCYSCNQNTHEDNTRTVYHNDREQSVCDGCYHEQYETCDNCGDRHNNLTYDEDTEQDLCTDCYDQLPANDSVMIRDYSYKPSPIFKKSYDCEEPMYMGVELEVEIDKEVVSESFLNKELIYLKKDGSLTSGFEIISHPMTLSYHKKNFNWREILQGLISNDGKSHQTDTCGIHVHVSSDKVSFINQWKLVRFFYQCSSKISILSRRKIFRYCEFRSLDKYGVDRHDLCYADTIKSKRPYNRDRYSAINFQNSKTIEFRIFRGTLKDSTFFSCLEFCKASVEFVQVHGYSSFCLSDETQIWKNFCNYLSDTNKYNNLIKYLKSKQIFN